jgi:feruloyl esterase
MGRTAVAAAVFLMAGASAAAPARAGDCAALAGSHGAQVQVSRATAIDPPRAGWVASAQGPYKALPVHVRLCRVEGMIEANIGFELWLPEAWNGRLLGAGVGGDAGVFNYTDMSRRVEQGFATVTTDAGHKAGQPRWMRDAKARRDYEHRAVHLTAVAAKALLAAFYEKPAARSYFLGCSGGGRQALKELQLYPADYDGIVAGAPGPYMPLISVRMMYFSLLQKRAPAASLSDADWNLYERATIAACDRIDGVSDGIMEDPRRCGFKPRALLCTPGQSDACLSQAKVDMLGRIVAPMRDERGRPMDKGLLPGVRTRPGPPSPLLRAMWADAVHDDPDWNEEGFRRTEDLRRANQVMPQLRADSVRIAPFIARGGKAIIYQGWQDPSVIAQPTIDYYEAAAAANGGQSKLARSVRLFMAPGMYHCRGGAGADSFGGSAQDGASTDPARDLLWAVIAWVEQGRAPERIEAEKRREDGAVLFSRALCAWPRRARYEGGPAERSSSYACALPQEGTKTLPKS